MAHYHTIVVGGGQAGLGTSYYLAEKGIHHTVLESRRIGESWRSQRWDSFALNSPNSVNILPGDEGPVRDADGFWHRDEFVGFLEDYAKRFQLPVQTGARVTSLRTHEGRGRFQLQSTVGSMTADNVVVASGGLNIAKTPAVAGELPASLMQLHAEHYRNPQALPRGATLVIGSGQSGVQIVEELLEAGRKVYLATSNVGRVFRRLRGKDFIEWGKAIGFFDQMPGDLEDPNMIYNSQPQVSGTRGGHTVSLQSLEKMGATLLGRFDGWRDDQFCFRDNLAENVEQGDRFSAKFRDMVEDYIAKQGIEAPPAETNEADEPDTNAQHRNPPTTLKPDEAGISSVIWCTGFKGDFAWIDGIELDSRGNPVHEKGKSGQPGLYFCGLPWLSKRKSGLIFGIREDAAYIVDQIASS